MPVSITTVGKDHVLQTAQVNLRVDLGSAGTPVTWTKRISRQGGQVAEHEASCHHGHFQCKGDEAWCKEQAQAVCDNIEHEQPVVKIAGMSMADRIQEGLTAAMENSTNLKSAWTPHQDPISAQSAQPSESVEAQPLQDAEVTHFSVQPSASVEVASQDAEVAQFSVQPSESVEVASQMSQSAAEPQESAKVASHDQSPDARDGQTFSPISDTAEVAWQTSQDAAQAALQPSEIVEISRHTGESVEASKDADEDSEAAEDGGDEAAVLARAASVFHSKYGFLQQTSHAQGRLQA
jgi:hypothetical protein